MGRAGLSKVEVFDVATKLHQESGDTTIERVRAELGTGSNTTISKYLKEWRELNEQELKTPFSLKIPSQLLSVAQNLWDTARNHAEQEASIVIEAANNKITEAQALLDDEICKARKMEENLKNVEQSLSQQTQVSEKLSAELEQERQTNAAFKSQVIAIEAHLAQQKEENAKLHQLSQSLQRNWEHLEKTSQEQQDKLKDELDNIRHQSDHQIKHFRAEAQQLLQDKQILQNQIEELKGNYHQLKSENLELHKQLERKVFENDSLKKKLDQVSDENIHLQKKINDNQKVLHVVEIQQAAIITDNKNLSEAVNQLKGKIQFLESKNQEISGEKHKLEGRLQQLQSSLINSEQVVFDYNKDDIAL